MIYMGVLVMFRGWGGGKGKEKEEEKEKGQKGSQHGCKACNYRCQKPRTEQ